MTETLHPKLRLEIILESPALRRAENILREGGATGWTVLPAVSGFGGTHRWSRGTDISASTDMVVMICIGDEDILLPLLEKLQKLLARHIGVLNFSEVKVLRDGLF